MVAVSQLQDSHFPSSSLYIDPEDLQRSPLFQLIGNRAYHFFLLFQCFVVSIRCSDCEETKRQKVDSVDGIDPQSGNHSTRSMLIGGPGAWIPYPSHSLLTYLGPSISMIMLDCRAERTLNQVCSETTYRRVFDRLWDLPHTVKHLVVQIGTCTFRSKDFIWSPAGIPIGQCLEHTKITTKI